MTLRDLNDIISKEVNMEKRKAGKEEYKVLIDRLQTLKSEFDSVRAIRQEAEKKKQHNDLVTFRNPNERAHQPPLEHDSYLRQESTVLDYGHKQVEDFIQMGQQALENLRFQRSTFKGAERRVIDVAQRLGVSDSVIRFIKQRQGGDRVVFWLCIIGATLFLLWIVYRRLF
jgi:Golgi SNAP receptor complex protein 2